MSIIFYSPQQSATRLQVQNLQVGCICNSPSGMRIFKTAAAPQRVSQVHSDIYLISISTEENFKSVIRDET